MAVAVLMEAKAAGCGLLATGYSTLRVEGMGVRNTSVHKHLAALKR